MPFSPPWRAYQAGDLLYGLAGPRHALAIHMGVMGVYTIDEYALVAGEKAPWDASSALSYDQGFIDSLADHKKYREILDGSELRDSPSREVFNARAKRKCKGGINYIVSNTVHHIHFCLDGLDPEQVPKKTYDGTGAPNPLLSADNPQGKAPDNMKWTQKQRSITGAELRWIFRNKNRSEVQSRIQFWLANTECYPPWGPPHPVKWRTAWASYVPAHTA